MNLIIEYYGDTVNVRIVTLWQTSPCRVAVGTVCSCTCRCCLIKMISHRRRRKPQKPPSEPLQPGGLLLPAETFRLFAAHSTFFSSNYLQERTLKSPVLLLLSFHQAFQHRGEITGSAIRREGKKERGWVRWDTFPTASI